LPRPDDLIRMMFAKEEGLPVDQAALSACIRSAAEALNHALANIPPEQLLTHLCWGNYKGPHHYDVPAKMVNLVGGTRLAWREFW
jgi:hypothetical protein